MRSILWADAFIRDRSRRSGVAADPTLQLRDRLTGQALKTGLQHVGVARKPATSPPTPVLLKQAHAGSDAVLAWGTESRPSAIESLGRRQRRRRSKKRRREARKNDPRATIYAVDSFSTGSDTIPWGTRLVLGERDPDSLADRAAQSYVFLMDTGISSATGDLNIIREWGYNFILPGSSTEDDNGHGTHLAGTIGALANGIGIVGIAPGVNLIPYKVLDRNGMGSLTNIVTAIDRMLDTIATQQLNPAAVVVNLSFGTRGHNPILQAAISRATALGVRFVIAAGNSGSDVDGSASLPPFIPASFGQSREGVYATSAITSSLQMAGFSNYDRISSEGDLDNIAFAAPGERVLSWYRQSDGSFSLASLSGTSMAAAHVSGLLALGGISPGPMASAKGAIEPDPIALLAPNPL